MAIAKAPSGMLNGKNKMLATIYDLNTGRILSTMSLTSVNLNIQDGQGILVGEYDSSVYWVVDSEPTLLPERPSLAHEFDYTLGKWVETSLSPDDLSANLILEKLTAISYINAVSGNVRRKYITDLPGQEALYLRKESEAKAWVVDPNPSEQDYPLISAEIGITAPSGNEVAQIYLNLAAIYVQAAAHLETARFGYIALVEAASTVEDVQVAKVQFTTALAQVGLLE